MYTLDSDMHVFNGEIGRQKKNQAGVVTLSCLLVLRNLFSNAIMFLFLSRILYMDELKVVDAHKVVNIFSL